ncbi:MAG: tyrosine-protein kinase family protein [gamma proteobacterium endosymbiont of Lamellibrachia anaximandri]|nr:tyrosine-protein kinase family protein [gamma proteobacterium endosymbiont of Lamellibrachia anaximandri]MBL3618487.1 tyrosine-protein kinase family protein [gamma proteobacterium endosymbiont of Lamellibrachia anaximandri]
MVSSIEKAIDRLNKERSQDQGGGSEQIAAADEVLVESDNVDAESKSITGGGTEDGKGVVAVNQDVSTATPIDAVAAAPGFPEKEICEIDFETLGKAGYLVPNSDQQRLSEEYRIIKRPLLMNAFGKGAAPVERGNLVLVTSSFPGEGKTYTAINLGVSIATELDSTILLVDGDVLKSSLSKLLGMEDKPGLIDVLEDPTMDLGDVIQSTQVPKLKILPAGRRHQNSTELLASESMEKILTELAERYPDRIVLFDAPPMLATTEAGVLTYRMGQIVMVVEAGKTPVDAVSESIAQLDPNKVIGLVLNKSRVKSGHKYYGSYYG